LNVAFGTLTRSRLVCGDNSRLRDTDIPWATEKGRLCWDEVAKLISIKEAEKQTDL
jgi:hypothetical protein